MLGHELDQAVRLVMSVFFSSLTKNSSSLTPKPSYVGKPTFAGAFLHARIDPMPQGDGAARPQAYRWKAL